MYFKIEEERRPLHEERNHSVIAVSQYSVFIILEFI